ncbi:shikimate dehydrogenase [Aureimonas flava]|uniref:Shikimate dehydrogenase n=1 Tax=Aureimonas flava TaxID=2320271 RepID=A0A3A1WFX0_9HYPH|nr:shikimate dehydrogenase [Aureimonas flava]RIX97982.1 shikimate dehydrogenase [Aureimonas flava]
MNAFASFRALGTEETLQLGLVGAGIAASRTPAMQEREGAAHGLRTVYRLFDTPLATPDDLGALVRAMELCGYAGFNVTYPFKIAILDHLHELDESARIVGAVNTVVLRDGRRIGFNTDLGGFTDAFAETMTGAARRRVLQIGAGGAGLAVAGGLLDCGVEELFVHDLDHERARLLVQRLEEQGRGRVRAVSSVEGAYDGIVNATPIGTDKRPGLPYPIERLGPETFVVDVNYFPLESQLIREAKARGCRTMGGAGMAVGQAVRAFSCFTGLRADRERMMAAFLALGA